MHAATIHMGFCECAWAKAVSIRLSYRFSFQLHRYEWKTWPYPVLLASVHVIDLQCTYLLDHMKENSVIYT